MKWASAAFTVFEWNIYIDFGVKIGKINKLLRPKTERQQMLLLKTDSFIYNVRI